MGRVFSVLVSGPDLSGRPGRFECVFGSVFHNSDREAIVLGDTLVNYGYERENNGNIYYSYFHSNIFFKYNYKRDTVLWSSRIGSDKSYTKILDIQLNKDGDPLFLGQAAGTQTSIGDTFEDTVEIFGISRSEFAKWDCVLFNIDKGTGEVDWATSTPEARFDVPQSFKQGSDGSIYVRASLSYGDTLRIRDTLIKQPIGIGIWGNSKGGLSSLIQRVSFNGFIRLRVGMTGIIYIGYA